MLAHPMIGGPSSAPVDRVGPEVGAPTRRTKLTNPTPITESHGNPSNAKILEALHFLHAVCKLIHRNLTPSNILLAANDNWRLAGLEFAVRLDSVAARDLQEQAAGFVLLLDAAPPPPPTSGGRLTLRRQRTLHQTRCDGPSKERAGLAHPELNYLAPEISKQGKCSHKSDIFSFGLVLCQCFDFFRHKPLISCSLELKNYDSELKKLTSDRGRLELGKLLPSEWRDLGLQMLELEPQLRPSASHIIQIVRRPAELCKANESSLRHLRSSLSQLSASQLQPQAAANVCLTDRNGKAGSAARQPRHQASYFRRVVSTAASGSNERAANQTKSLRLLNLLLRQLDALANEEEAEDQATELLGGFLQPCDEPEGSPQQQTAYREPFDGWRRRFELSMRLLEQLYGPPPTEPGDESSPRAAGAGQPGDFCGPRGHLCADSSALMLAVALHRRLLEQIGRMRRELPPFCRLASSSSKLAQNHRSLARMEDKLMGFVSQQSVARLVATLADPTLKIEEFLLVHELLNDLLAFVGQKCRQNLTHRAKLLLQELTPVTGGPTLSSSSSEYEDQQDEEQELIARALQAGASSGQPSEGQMVDNQNCEPHEGQWLPNQPEVGSSRESRELASRAYAGHRYSEFGLRLQQQHQLPPLPATTKISITAPSPMGSMRDLSRLGHGQPEATAATMADDLDLGGYTSQSNQSSTNTSNQSLESGRRLDEQQLCARTSRLSLALAGQPEEPADEQQPAADSKSRSKLIDELLKTINDDSFNDLVDLNNKFVATGASRPPTTQQQPPPLARPKSAMDGSQQHQVRQPQRASGRPSSLALGAGPPKAVPPSSPSGFNNVIRRMSTNLVQNFNKQSHQDHLDSLGQRYHANDNQSMAQSVRRERSHIPATNSLYVDNQVPIRRHSDNTINVPRIQVALSSPQGSSSRTNLNQRASVSASKLANKWKLTATSNKRDSYGADSSKLSPNLSGALGYMRRHSSGNTTGNNESHSNAQSSSLLFNVSPFKTKSSSNLGLDFLLSNRSMKRRCSAASMLGHQTQRKAEDLIDAGMKSMQNMFS